MKGALSPDHMPQNKWRLTVRGLPPLLFVQVNGLEEEMDRVELPDRTAATGGRSKPFEFTVMQPMHHTAEVDAMENWYQQGKDRVSLEYKKPGIITFESLSGINRRSYTLTGLWVSKRSPSDLDMDNDGDEVEIEWTLSCDEMNPLR